MLMKFEETDYSLKICISITANKNINVVILLKLIKYIITFIYSYKLVYPLLLTIVFVPSITVTSAPPCDTVEPIP